MIVNDLLHEYRPPAAGLTTSGAGIEPIGSEAAQAFLARRDKIGTVFAHAPAAWGAFIDGTTLIGLAVLSISSSSQGQACVVVVPECQRLGVGSDLAAVLVHEVQGHGLATLAYTCSPADPVPQQFVRSLDLISARRVHGDAAVTVLVLPDSTSATPRGDSEPNHSNQ